MRRFLLALAAALLLAACADDAGVPTLTPPPTPSLPAQAVVIFVLKPSQVPGYARTADQTLNAGAVADTKNDPTLAARLIKDGFVHGATDSFAPPPNTISAAFGLITSTALLFNDAAGATLYYDEEAGRIDAAPPGGTVAPLGGLPSAHVDTMLALTSEQAARTDTPVDRAFIALMRTGRVVTELFANGTSAANTTAGAFLPLVTAQQTLLARSPEG